MKHPAFILSPITKIVEETVTACYGIGKGMRTLSISEYVFQSLFLRMTGAQEQKMKCLCWDMATYDYEYRREKFGKNNIGECSIYADKNSVIKKVISISDKLVPNFVSINKEEKEDLIKELNNDIKEMFGNSIMKEWAIHNYNDCLRIIGNLKGNHFLVNGKELFNGNLQKIYKSLYDHRNRCAHNTLSYQENLPKLKTLYNEGANENYFLRYAILILIDKITITLYKKYLDVMGMQI